MTSIRRPAKVSAGNAPPRVYSYVRFSTPEQIKGDSLRRQIEASEAWCKRKGLTLDDTLRISDFGVSGFKGKNADVGALATFLKAVEDGQKNAEKGEESKRTVPKGSYLLVENLDRLSRDVLKQALARFLDLINAGITIVTLYPEREFGEDVADFDIILAIVEMSRAHGESQRKSELRGKRCQADRERMRKECVALTKICPAWMEKKGDRYELIPERAEVVRQIFKLRLEGLGPNRICQRLNQSASWKPQSRRRGSSADHPGWRESYVKRILESRAVIGELQPHVVRHDPDTRKRKRIPEGEPIKGLYPAVIDEKTFLAAQTKSKGKRNGGRTGKASNVLRGLVRCGYCGGAMHHLPKGLPPKGSVVLQCDQGRRGLGCKTTTIDYHAVEQAVLWNSHKLRPADVLPSDDDRKHRVAECRSILDELRALKNDRESQIDNLTDQIARSPIASIRDKYEQRIVALNGELSTIESKLVEAEAALVDAERTTREFANWQADIGKLIEAISDEAAIDIRLRLNDHLKKYLVDIECFPAGYPEGSEEDEIESYVDTVLDEFRAGDKLRKQASGFVQWLIARRTTRQGSFVRLRFPNGATRTLAIGPAATGYVAKTLGGKVQSVHRWPDLDHQLARYKKVKYSLTPLG